MHSRKARTAGALVAAALAFGAATAPVAAAAPDAPQRTVTLVTGDKVVLDGTGRVLTVRPAAGREGIRFVRTQERGHTSVIPQDAGVLLAQDKLDRRLFDVTTLVEFGYEDAKTTQLPLIVNGRGVLTTRSADAFRSLTGSGQKVWLDGIRKPSLDRSIAQIGAPAAHQAGITGKGVKVAVLDTGVDANHPDLRGKQLVEKNFTEDPDATDNVGHGTHVAATIASGDAKFRGVAPDSQILDGKVCVEFGCAESWILDGMRWAAEQGADVVNLSLGGGDTPEIDPLEDAVNTLSDRYGTLFVIAAGNSGGSETVSSPGSAEAALTVGAVDRDDSIAPFSSRGPRIGDGGVKPDVTAPGVGIVAAKAGTTERMAASGTSMATPHVAGAAALLAQQHPDWPGSQLKAALVSTAKPTAGAGPFDQGTGRIDVAKAITQELLAAPVSVNLGLQRWPHADDVPVTKQLTYLNPADTPVTLDLKLDSDAPFGMFTLSSGRVTVPAKGKASVSLTSDTRVGTKDGAFTGTVLATAGAQSVRSLVSVVREVESYDVTMDFVNRDGKPAVTAFSSVVGLDVAKSVYPAPVNGSVKLRLPKGTYNANSYVLDGGTFDMLVQPALVVSGDVRTTIDASLAKPVSVKIPDETGDFVIGDLSYQRTLGNFSYGFGLISLGGFDNTRSLHIGPDLPAGELTSLVQLQANSASDETTFYRVASTQTGRFYTGHESAPRKEDLARTETRFGRLIAGAVGSKGAMPQTDSGMGGSSAIYPVPAGRVAIDYLSPGVKWEHIGLQDHPQHRANVWVPAKSYQAGGVYQEKLFYAVYGPAVPQSPYAFVSRSGDDLYAGVPLFGDANGGSGSSSVDSGRTALYRNGQLVAETDRPGGGSFLKLPAQPAEYRLETSAARSAFELSTSVSSAWTFRSGRTTPGDRTPLPVSAVKFTPALDDADSVKAGRLLRVPFSVQQQGGGKYGNVGVEVSFDDGKTWRRAGVVGNSALIYHPDANGYASLRATARDDKGNSVTQTIIRAYKVTK